MSGFRRPIDYNLEPYEGERDQFVGQPGIVAGAGMHTQSLVDQLEGVKEYGLMSRFFKDNKAIVVKLRALLRGAR